MHPDAQKSTSLPPDDYTSETPAEAREFDFGCVHTDNFPAILEKLNISLAVTSYQSQRLFFVRARTDKIDINYKAFPRPMGVYADKERLTLGTLTRVQEFKRNDPILQKIKNGALDRTETFTKKVLEQEKDKKIQFEEERNKELTAVKLADALYLSRASLTTGMINIHDVAWGQDGLWVVNSTFSCLCTLSPQHSFIARWKPAFITELVPEDRCHLNGMAMKNGRPQYVTTFNRFNSKDSWVNNDIHDGTLIDIDTDEILLEGLIMPHSPRYYRGNIYLCDSGRGEILQYDPVSREKIRLAKLQGFPRGMNFFGPLMFVGLSQTRVSENRPALPIAEEYDETFSGVWIINIENGEEIGHIRFTGDVQQIYDIAVVPDSVYPELLDSSDSLIRHTFDYLENFLE